MARFNVAGLFFCVAAIPPSAAQSGLEALEIPHVTVRVYNYAAVDDRIISAGLETASSIFVEADVPVRFLDCTLTPGGQPANAGCHRLRGPSALSLRILPNNMLPPSGLPEGIFGFAMMSDTELFPIVANLYFDLIAGVADGRLIRRGVLLGNMMAHEAGHLLLGSNSHSKAGIMSIPWTSITLRQADQGRLVFSKDEIRKMNAACQRRQTPSAATIAAPARFRSKAAWSASS